MHYEFLFLKALGLTVALEVLSGGGLKLFFSRPLSLVMPYWKLFLGIASASILTLPYLWFIFPGFLRGNIYIISSEIFAITIETIFYRVFLVKKTFPAFLLSLITNLFSYFIGRLLI